MGNCNNCNESIKKDGLFCTNCGATVDKKATSVPPITFCTKCGSQIPQNCSFCVECGNPIVETNINDVLGVDEKPCYTQISTPEACNTIHESAPPNNSKSSLYSSLIKKISSLGANAKIGIIILLIIGAITQIHILDKLTDNAPEITAKYLAEQYSKNPLAAARTYSNTRMGISGQVYSKGQFTDSTDIFIEVYKQTLSNDRKINVLIQLPIEARDRVNKIQVGDIITAKGTCVGVVPQSKDNVLSIQIRANTIK